MDQKTYENWWQLHLLVVKGKKLSEAQQVEYEAGLSILDEEEKVEIQTNRLATLRQMRLEVEELQTINDRLKEKSNQLDKKIADLEKRYQSITGFTLTAKPYASP